jgi:hypothetical protein
MKKHTVTFQLRENAGKFDKVTDKVMIAIGHERMGFCEACGKEIENHFGVKNGNIYLWVGGECQGVLTGDIAPELATGETYKTNDNRVWINPDCNFIDMMKSVIAKWESEGTNQFSNDPAYNGLVELVKKSGKKNFKMIKDQYDFYMERLPKQLEQ